MIREVPSSLNTERSTKNHSLLSSSNGVTKKIKVNSESSETHAYGTYGSFISGCSEAGSNKSS